MFKKAIKDSSNYTKELICGFKKYKGNDIDISVSSMIQINEDGWFLTCKHVCENLKCSLDVINNKNNIDNILKESKRNKKILKENGIEDNYIVASDIVFPFEINGKIKIDIFTHESLDIGLIHINNIKIRLDNYPVFKKELPEVGTSVCKLGYAFNNGNPFSYDKENNKVLKTNKITKTLFPYEGIVTRIINLDINNSFYEKALVETSTAGIKGQSGGPIFDEDNKIVAIQSMNVTMPLDTVGIYNNERIPQFINLGLGVSSVEIIKFLDKYNVKYKS